MVKPLFGEEFNLQLDKKGEIHATLFGAQAGSFLQGYGEFKDAAAAQNPAQTQLQTNARNNLGECSVYALLDTLSYSECADYNTVVKGTVIRSPNNPSLVGRRNVTITDFSQHPNILVNVGPGLNSTAAGMRI